MVRKLMAGMLILTFTLMITGCETIQEHPGAATGAGLGAASGAVAGALISKSTKGAVIGGLVGALIGGAIGNYAYDQKKTAGETAQTYNYQQTYGPMITLESVSCSPQTVHPGEVVEMKMTYAILNPTPNTQTNITEIREITQNGVAVGNPQVQIVRTDGTYSSVLPLKLPTNAVKGTYTVNSIVQSDTAKDSRQMTFTVK